jgi:hypothetical protein
MSRMNLPWTLFNRPIKPVALVLMNTMFVISWVAVTNAGVLHDSIWGDILGAFSFVIAVAFFYAWYKASQRYAEWAMLAAFGVWGFRFWAIILINGTTAFSSESAYLSLLWMLLAGGSWLLERADPKAEYRRVEGAWTRH